MTETKEFPTLDVVSVATGILVGELYPMYDVMEWMLDDVLMTHQMGNASRTLQPYLEVQHPWLAELELPAGDIPELLRITQDIVDEHGDSLIVERPENPEWVRGNAISDMFQLVDKDKVIPVTVPEYSVDLSTTVAQIIEKLEEVKKKLEEDK